MAKKTGVKARLDENKDEVIAKYLAGASTCELGREYGCSGGSIWLLLERHQVPIRTTARAKSQASKIVDMYKNGGMSAYRIAKELGVSNQAVNYQLRKAGIDPSGGMKKRAVPLSAHKDEIIALYNAWFGVDAIAKRYGTFGCNVNKLLRKNGVPVRSIRDYAYPVDEAYFDDVRTPGQAWACGWWFSDGCNSPQIPVLKLAITDEDVVRKIAAEMGWGGPVYVIPRKGYKTQYALAIGSRRLSDALLELGCLRRKSYHGIFPPEECVPARLHSHLVRGWFEGNGCLHKQKGRNSWTFSVSGTRHVCSSIEAAVKRATGVRGRTSVHSRTEANTAYHYVVTANTKVRAVMDWLYADSGPFILDRKFARYRLMLGAR